MLNANARMAGREHASTLAALAARTDMPVPIRVEALQVLAAWAKPPGLDRVVGLWRPLPPRPAKDAVVALRPVLPGLLRDAPDAVALAALRAIGPLPLKEAGPLLSALIFDASRKSGPRAEAIRALDRLDDDGLGAAVRRALDDRDPSLRVEARRLLARLEPGEAIPILESALEHGSVAERQGAFAALGDMPGPAADRALSRWLNRLGTKDVPPEIELDLIEAAAAEERPRDRAASSAGSTRRDPTTTRSPPTGKRSSAATPRTGGRSSRRRPRSSASDVTRPATGVVRSGPTSRASGLATTGAISWSRSSRRTGRSPKASRPS